MDYSVNVSTAGSYTINLRIATPNFGAQLQLKNGSGEILSTLTLPTTGGWQTWQTVSTTIALIQGVQTIRLQSASTAGWNINWLEVVGGVASNQPPTANAGTDQTITLPTNSVTLYGSGTDADGTIASYSWTQVNGGGALILSGSSASTEVMVPGPGSYIFRLTVTDNAGASGTNDVTVTVLSNNPPTVDAGMDQTIILPTSSVQLSGSGSDGDGTIASYAWTKVSGPAGETISSPSTASSAVNNLSEGVYTFRLTVTDNAGALASDDVLVTVNATTPSNQPPTVSAGADQTITLPTSSVNLTGSATDADGTIASYAWSKISGGSATITSPSNASTTITGLVQGSYTFRLTATDNKGATASDDVLITVNAQPTPVFSLRIEAESFSSASSVTRQPTQDIDGTEELSSLDNGDWMQYLVNVPYAGTYTVSFRVASTKGGSKFQLLNAAGSLLTTANLPNTGSLQNWQTVSVQATLEQGTQTFKILVNKASGNPTFNWWNISLVNTNTGTGSSTNQETLVAKDSEEINPASSSLQIFPNPFQDHFVMQIQNSYIGPVQVQLFNLNGALQKQFVFNKTNALSQETFHANKLSKGEYVLVMRMSNWEERKKIIKL
jgi:hypothetical protein